MISGNLTATISDHLPQFLLIPKNDVKARADSRLIRSFKNWNSDTFVQDISNLDWATLIKEGDNVNNSIKTFIESFNTILDKHAPYKPITNKQAKIMSKPWITKGILKSIKMKDKIHKKFIHSKDRATKEAFFNTFKKYRNTISNLIRISKKTIIRHFSIQIYTM